MQAETAEMMLSRALANYPNGNINASATLLLWLEQFDMVDDALIKEAFALTLKRCKFFPTVADLQESVDMIRQQMRTFNNIPGLEVGKNYESKMAKLVFETIAKMDTAKFVAEMEVEKEVVNYVRAKFLNISERLIKENYLEILQEKEGSEKCFGCVWNFGDCSTNGFFPSMELNANGQIHVSMMACQKRRAV